MISIIIPTLNEEKYLPILLSNLAEQNFQDKEIIVADAGSEDKTIEIAQSFGCKVIEGGLPARGRNQGAKAAKGDLLLFIDADVFLPENSLRNFLAEFQKRKLDVASFFLRPWGKSKFLAVACQAFYNFPILVMERILPHGAGAILIKKELHQKVNGFDETIKLAEDHYYIRQAAKFGRFGLLRAGKVLFSQRRFKKEGLAKVYFKYILCELYMIFWGPVRSDIFKYDLAKKEHKIN